MKKLTGVFVAMTLFVAQSVWADAVIKEKFPQAEKVGEARMTYLLWDVYDATLYAPKGEFTYEEPFWLELTYLRSLDGKSIADRSVEEMRKQGFTDEMKLAAWNTEMKRIFPDVKKGDKIIGFFQPNGETIFHNGKKELGTVKDAAFGKPFFDIWLSKKTSEPELRTKLLGQK